MNKTEFIVIVVITLIVVGIWGASEFIHSKNAALPNPDGKAYLEIVEPTFDQETLGVIGALQTPNPSATLLPTSTPAPTIRSSASPSATPRTTLRPSASPIFP